jgi:hypothetical protein
MAGTAGERSRLRRIVGLAGCGALVLTAIASCGSNTLLPATVYLTSTIGPVGNNSTCPFASVTSELQIGSALSGVKDGTAGTMVVCSVTPSGSQFNVMVQVQSSGGGFAVQGTMPAAGNGTGIITQLIFGQVGAEMTYGDNSCSVTMANNNPGNTTPDFPGGAAIAGGKVWATVTCEKMTTGGQPGICEGVLTFRMENCAGSPSS